MKDCKKRNITDHRQNKEKQYSFIYTSTLLDTVQYVINSVVVSPKNILEKEGYNANISLRVGMLRR